MWTRWIFLFEERKTCYSQDFCVFNESKTPQVCDIIVDIITVTLESLIVYESEIWSGIRAAYEKHLQLIFSFILNSGN